MAKWLKAAEDLFEVVDRRAKLVANDLSDEQTDLQPSASVEKEFQARRTKSKEKKLKKLSTGEPPKTSDTAQEQNVIQPTLYDTTASNGKVPLPSENAGTISDNSTAQTSNEMQLNIAEDMNALGHSSSDTLLASDVSKHDDDNAVEVTHPVNGVEVVTSSSNDEKPNESNSYVHEGYPPLVSGRGLEVVNGDHPVGGGQSPKLGDEGISLKIDQERSESESVETHSNNDTEVQDADHKGKPLSDLRMQQVYESDASSVKVQDQLDEAQGLLKTAISTGQSKEARLARVCAGLSSRLQEYKSENAQLEELLFAEREHSNSYEARIKQLQQDISISKIEATRVESNMAEALAAKNSEIEVLVSSMDALKKQAAVAEGNLASLQANMESSMRSRELSETRMMQALREELASAERRAVEERAAHNATKMAAMERQVELEHRSVEASTALARIQRIADERASKAAELEQKVALLEVECASLNQELQDTEARIRREQRRSSEESNQVLQMQAWQEEVERAHQGQRDAERKLSSMEAEVQKMRVEMAGMKRDAEHYSRQEHVELEKRYRELTDLLYYKQTQLETMASEKAAAEFQLEKEMKRLQEAQVEAERSRPSRRASSSWEEDTDLRTLEPLPLHHRHMVGASIQLQKAAKLLDSGAVRATRFLWRYPTARVILLFYLVFVHLFLMYLLHRLQEQADSFASREVAASMGLATPKLP